MEKSFKNKNILVIVFEILVIALGLGGITYATQRLINDRTATLITAGEYNLDYVGEEMVSATSLEPMADSLVNIDTVDNVMRIDFSVRGVKTNKNDSELIYDVMLSEINADCALLNKYTKWNLYKNGKKLSNGSLDPGWDGDVLGDSMRLTNIQEDLPKYNQDYDNYTLILWISEACDNIETCELIDQSNILNSQISMKVFIALYSGVKKEYKRTPSNDLTCANKPELYDKMIPITYIGGQWVVADKTNNSEYNLWYDYGNSKWANAVVVNDNTKYQNVGTVISNNDVLGYYVWIPRYRYKLWNVLDKVADSYNAYDNGIDIIFEHGVIARENSVIDNNKYITHPAFGDNLKGIWVSKYEISNDGNGYKFLPNMASYRGSVVDEYKNIGINISTDYGLNDKVDSHMISNLEWGSILYLSHSKYGVCTHDGCDSVGRNNSYTSGIDKQDTTTRNVYGVYDMAGGSAEYALGSEAIGTATKEVILENGDTWYNGHGLYTQSDFLIRGGLDRGLFYFGGMNMDPVETATRIVLKNK